MGYYAWQISLKPGEGPRSDDGRWLAHKSDNGHIIQSAKDSYETKEEALAAVGYDS